MNTSSLILVLVFGLVAGTWLIVQQVKALRRNGHQADAEQQQLRQQVAQLEQRVQTLERIATDNPARLRDQITSL
jgi:cell division protein FtsB